MRSPFHWTSTGGTAFLALAFWSCAVFVGPVDELSPQVGPDTRLLVFAPHPDDEALGAAGLIQRVKAAGGSVDVVLMTSGDAFSEGVEAAADTIHPTRRDFRTYGKLREAETLAAMQLVGIDRDHITFLGFPDDGLCLIASKYLSSKRAFASPYTGRAQPPVSEQVIPNVTYRGEDVRREVEAILMARRPTLIVLPHPEDRHPEHCATSIFVREALAAVASQHPVAPRLLNYLVHYDQWPNLDEVPASGLRPPPAFPSGEGEWRSLTLTNAEAALKRRMIAAYPSQMEVMSRFLRAFGRPNELFVEGPVASPPECWCDGTHVATETPPERYRHRPAERR